jgi:hypothetical protein
MTALFIAMVLAVFAGGVSLWMSGLFLGRRVRSQVFEESEGRELERLRGERERLESSLTLARGQIQELEAHVKVFEAAKSTAESELARAAIELGRVEGEMLRADDELKRLEEENEQLRDRAEKQKLIKPPAPVRSDTGDGPQEVANEDLDVALAQLDMERVAHKKTRDELEQVKKGFAVQISDGRTSVIPPVPGGPAIPGRRGAGFQTVSIASRALPVSAADHDRLRQLNDQLKRDKEQVEADLARAQQELQLLKMRLHD